MRNNEARWVLPSPATEHRIGQKRVVGPKTKTPYLTQKTASCSVTGGKKVTTLLRFTTKKERMEGRGGEKKVFYDFAQEKDKLNRGRASKQDGRSWLRKMGTRPKKGRIRTREEVDTAHGILRGYAPKSVKSPEENMGPFVSPLGQFLFPGHFRFRSLSSLSSTHN